MTNRSSAASHRPFAVLAALVGVVATAVSVSSVSVSAAPDPKGDYIVVLHSESVASAGSVADDHRRNRRAEVSRVYEHALKGYAATMRASDAAALRSDPRVDYVEADQVVHASTEQTGATWGLDRINQPALPLDNLYSYTANGAGVSAYIIDSGIRLDHTEYRGRISSGFDAVDGGTADDCNGHGTHVAGTVGGTTYGVAKGVSLVAVRVLNCAGSGSWSGVIAGINWVAGSRPAGPAVANLSLGGGASTAVDDAVKNLIATGVTVAVAAGNGNVAGKAQNACNYSPARVPDALTIGATTQADAKTSFSNYGSCVDWFAPGSSITSAWHSSAGAINTISGTSMASPHTAGVAALYLQDAPTATTGAVRAALAGKLSLGKVTSAKTLNNHLLFTNY